VHLAARLRIAIAVAVKPAKTSRKNRCEGGRGITVAAMEVAARPMIRMIARGTTQV